MKLLSLLIAITVSYWVTYSMISISSDMIKNIELGSKSIEMLGKDIKKLKKRSNTADIPTNIHGAY